jgi:hypothetical protein
VLPVPPKNDLTAALALDLELVLAGHFFVGGTGRGVFGGRGQAPFHLLPEEEVIEVHGESPHLGA